MTNAKPKHQCPAPGCTRMVRQGHIACAGHWVLVPEHLRSRLWATYRSADPARRWQAMADCRSLLEAAEVTRIVTEPKVTRGWWGVSHG